MKIVGKKVAGICRAAKASGEFRLRLPFWAILKTYLVPYSHGIILELIALAYVSWLVLMQQVGTFVTLMFMLVLMLMLQCKPGFSYLIVRIFNFSIFYFSLWHDFVHNPPLFYFNYESNDTKTGRVIVLCVQLFTCNNNNDYISQIQIITLSSSLQAKLFKARYLA